MTGTSKQAGRPQPTCAEEMGGTLSQPEKDFIFPLLQIVLKMFGTVSKFIDYSLVHDSRPPRTRVVNPARSMGKGNPVNLENAISTQINGSPRNFPEWWVVEWVITVVMRKSPEEDRIAALNKLGWMWAEVRGERPWGFVGAIPDADALTDPADVEAEETKYAVLRTVTVPSLRHEIARLKALHETPQGRHVNFVEEIADLKASLGLMEEAKNAADLRTAEAEDLAAHARLRNNELEERITELEERFRSLQEQNDELVRVNVEVNHKFEHLRTLWHQRKTASPTPMSGTLDMTPAAETTAVMPVVPAHPQTAEALSPGAITDEIAQQRHRHYAGRKAELEGVANDSLVDTMLMEIGDLLAFRAPRDLRDEVAQHGGMDTPSASSGQGA
ncbi:hypothetical protein LFM09_42015 [Lentzea alba]|uniref:hypothetical protein n=1 Tax=Lentzea alba TaxID=2714351 RepID=UPI0039BF4EED